MPIKSSLRPEDAQIWHGTLGNPEWPAPKLTYKNDNVARKGANYISMSKNEYRDYPEVVAAKVKILAQMVKKSKNCLIYTGAGISRNAGVDDYASAKNTMKAGVKSLDKGSYRLAKPTKAHYVISEMAKKGYAKHWLQQNHDGLAHKAGCPDHMINEIHGSWHDMTNKVIPMSGALRAENF